MGGPYVVEGLVPSRTSEADRLTYSIDDFEARSPDELTLIKGEKIELIERDDDFGDGWYLGKHMQNGKTGLFPEGLERIHEETLNSLLIVSYSLHNSHPSSIP